MVFGGKWKAILGEPAPQRSSNTRSATAAPPKDDRGYVRQSSGLAQFFSAIDDFKGFPVLDLAGASQANISFITEAGFRLFSDDIVRSLELAFGEGSDFLANQADQQRVERFMVSTLDFPEGHFCGAMLWDCLQFLTQPLLQDTVSQLHDILLPGASMFAIFHANEKTEEVPVYSYRIADQNSVMLTARNRMRPAQFLNNRAIEKLFQNFHSVKFFLTRDHLREVIVRR
jgi:hypothetical protein